MVQLCAVYEPEIDEDKENLKNSTETRRIGGDDAVENEDRRRRMEVDVWDELREGRMDGGDGSQLWL